MEVKPYRFKQFPNIQFFFYTLCKSTFDFRKQIAIMMYYEHVYIIFWHKKDELQRDTFNVGHDKLWIRKFKNVGQIYKLYSTPDNAIRKVSRWDEAP